MKKKPEEKKSNFNYHLVIRDKKSVETYFKSKYNLPFLTKEEKNKLIELRNKKYPNYESQKYYKRVEYINNMEIKKAIRDENKDINLFYKEGGRMVSQSKIDIIDLILLKELQVIKYEKELKELKNLIKEKEKSNNLKKELFKRQKNNRQKNNNKNEEYNQELEDMCIYSNIIKKEIKEEKQKSPENFIEIKDALNLGENDKETFALGLLANNLQEKGIEVAIKKIESKEEQDLDAGTTCLQFLTNSMHSKKKYDLHFDFGEKKNSEYLNDKKEFANLKEKLKLKLSKEYNIPKDKIIITYPQKGSLSVQIIFQSDEFNELNLEQFKQKFKKDKEFSELQNLKEIHTDVIFGACKLNKNQLDSRGNRVDGWGINEERGNIKYYPPLGWKGIGLKVLDKYDQGNNAWIGMNNMEGEWCVAYHGVGRYQSSEEVKKITGAIYKSEFKPGDSQGHENHEDINHLGNKVGKGVYCTPFVDVAEKYAGISNINGKCYKTVLMVRVKPSAIRTCEDQKDYWVVNGTKDEIRPYRILYKCV